MSRVKRYLSSLLSLISPSTLECELETAPGSDGRVTVNPAFYLRGQRIDLKDIQDKPHQWIGSLRVKVPRELREVARQAQDGALTLTRSKAAEFLKSAERAGAAVMARHGGTRRRVQIEELGIELGLSLKDEDRLVITSDLILPSGVVVEKTEDINNVDGGWFEYRGDLLKVPTVGPRVGAAVFTTDPTTELTGDLVPAFLEEVEKLPNDRVHLEKDEALSAKRVLSPRPDLRTEIDVVGEALKIRPAAVYRDGGQTIHRELFDRSGQPLDQGSERYRKVSSGWVKRDVEAEGEVANKVHLLNALCQEEYRGERIPEILSALPSYTNRSPWTVYLSKEVKEHHRLVEERARFSFKLGVTGDKSKSLLYLDPKYLHDRFSVTHKEAAALVRDGKRWLRRDDAWIRIDADKVNEVDRLAKREGLREEDGRFSFGAAQRVRVVELFSRLGSAEHSADYAEFLRQLADFTRIEEVEIPPTVKDGVTFRAYQRHGLNWLEFLRRFGLNGILADDMGLGKTLQTLAVIARAREVLGREVLTLVVCPSSVTSNWQRESSRFFDGFSSHIYHGSNRAPVLRRVGRSINLVITSYGVAANDVESLSQVPWDYLVVDEGHYLKNPAASRTKAIKAIPAVYKLALTGTPIQNRPDELWSLFDFTMPGYLGNLKTFKGAYDNLIKVESDGFRGRAQELHTRIRPFVMRRLKKDVLDDLPEKSIIDYPVDLSPRQVRLYKQFASGEEFEKLAEELKKKSVGQAKLQIISLYQRLRNICNHPCLEDGGDYSLEDSGKLEGLQELMQEVIEGEHRALLFCQSTKMLSIIERFFQEWRYTYRRLDGTTTQGARQRLVDEFNGNETINCFLISTKAGGTGLNLVGADTVIFYDHDWNPANDAQAQDRAYRIGQTKNVSVYRLISSGTIEERIIERQSAKQLMADAVIGADTEGFKDISREELLDLFQYRAATSREIDGAQRDAANS